MTSDKISLPELLAPAGSAESLRAALAAGADAVYFGGTAFSNRMRAKNFGTRELSDAVKLCHSAGAAAHITVNTRVRDREMDDVLRLVDALVNQNEQNEPPDALIVADLGIARELHRRYPALPLHASTQTSLSSPADCLSLAEMGFTRLVIPRELTRWEIRELCAASGIEIEMFIHGAHCVSLSGQCLLSYMMGGRSGNRGECAQPCRLPFDLVRIDGVSANTPNNNVKYGSSTGKSAKQNCPLSLADMCLAGRITEVISSGVRSLKIEGRLKPAQYVYETTKIYRTLLDERRNATPAEIKSLELLFSRGFTDGYFAHNYANMSGANAYSGAANANRSAKSADISAPVTAELEERVRAKKSDEANPREQVKHLVADFTLRENSEARFTLRLKASPEISVTAVGVPPEAASGTPLSKEAAAKNLTKFGGTKYSLSPDDITFSMDNNLWYPVSALNSLRRTAVSLLDSKLGEITPAEETPKNPEFVQYSPEKTRKSPQKFCRSAEVASIQTLYGASDNFYDYFDIIYLPHDEFPLTHSKSDGENQLGKRLINQHFEKIAAQLPICSPSDDQTKKILAALKNSECRRVLCHTIGQIRLAKEAGFIADMSFRANITNTAAYAEYHRIGCDKIILSPELPPGAVADIGGGAIVYGKIPVMTLSRCVICGGKCPLGRRGGRVGEPNNYTLSPNSNLTKSVHKNCRAILGDRMGEELDVIGFPAQDCVNIVYNSVPTWMADRSEVTAKIAHHHFMFTTENSSEADDVVRAYQQKRTITRGRRI